MTKRLLDLLIARSFRRGLRGQSTWLVVGAAAWLWRRSRARKDPRPVWTADLAPGQAVVITHHVEAA